MLTLPLLIVAAMNFPVPKAFDCWIDVEKASFSTLENPTPTSSAPVGLSFTLYRTSTWSLLVSTGRVSTVASVKYPVRSMRRRESWIFEAS